MATIRIDKTAKSGAYVNRRWCNLDCLWCHNDYFSHNGFLSITNADIVLLVQRIINVASFSDVQIRIAGGGEPTLVGVSELSDLISRLRTIPQISQIKLTTNGILLGDYAESLKNAGLDAATVSLNALTNEGYRYYSRRNKLDTVLTSLRQAYSVGLRLKINAIYWAGNKNDISKYEALSAKMGGLPIKFFDLIPNDEFVQRLYLPLSQLEEQIQVMQIPYVDKYTPYYQREYTFPSGAVFIVKKSSDVNDCPNTACKFRDVCVEGCRHSIRLGINGILKPCGVRSDNEVNLLQHEITDNDIWNALHAGGKVGY